MMGFTVNGREPGSPEVVAGDLLIRLHSIAR